MPSFTVFFVVSYFHFCFAISSPNLTPNVTVDIKGSGDYSTIKAAIENAPTKSMFRYVVHIKQGFYTEYVNISQDKWNITIFGDGKDKTIISSDRSNVTKFSILQSAAIIAAGDGFVALNLTVQNVAGPEGLQAVALYSTSPFSAFYNLAIKGHQDSLHVGKGPQFYTECSIYGTVDFILGEGPAVFQKCRVFALKTRKGKENVITANGCIVKQNCGFSFHLCNITGSRKLLEPRYQSPTFLGRPWKNHSTTVFMQSEMTKVIDKKGWLDWKNLNTSNTLFYGEYMNTGEGAAVDHREQWIGVHSSLTEREAESFTVSGFIKGHEWLPQLGIQYVPGLKV